MYFSPKYSSTPYDAKLLAKGVYLHPDTEEEVTVIIPNSSKLLYSYLLDVRRCFDGDIYLTREQIAPFIGASGVRGVSRALSPLEELGLVLVTNVLIPKKTGEALCKKSNVYNPVHPKNVGGVVWYSSTGKELQNVSRPSDGTPHYRFYREDYRTPIIGTPHPDNVNKREYIHIDLLNQSVKFEKEDEDF